MILPIPDTNNLAVAEPVNIWAEATLYRDTWGVPHILAENPRALAFAFGYAQAEDHLETMLLAYRTANGSAATILGESYAESDAFSLKMGHARLAREALMNADSITRALCEGFAMGVNAWIMDYPNLTPEWAEGVHPADILALWHAFVMSQTPFDLPDKYRRPRAMETGNAWALAPDRTREGKTLLVINPHQYHTGPFQWYEAHLILGHINIYGATLKGLPVIVQGYNEQLGWALTPNFPDTGDMFQEQFQTVTRNPRDPRRSIELLPMEQALALHYMSQAKPYYVKTASGLEERITPAYIGPRGPIFEGRGGDLYSWRIGGYYDFGGLRQLFEMGRAQDLTSFQQALGLGQIPSFHVVYADKAGNLFYLYNAKTGIRMPHLASNTADLDPDFPPALQQAYQQGVNWREPLPAHFESVAWGQYVPISMLPSVLNPTSGYIQATGNMPWSVTDDTDMDPRAWPGWLIADQETYRAQRVRQLLRQGRRSFTDMQAMLYDKVVPAAVEMVPMLLSMANQRPDLLRGTHPDLPAGLELLRDWDRSASIQSTGMTFYHVWWAMLRARAGQQFPNDSALYHTLLQNSETAQEYAIRAADDAARMMRNDFQTISIPWGEVHRIRRGYREEAVPGSGTGDPIFVASDFAIDNKRWQATYGYGMAMAIQFGDAPEAVSVVPFGTSDRQDSPHYDDQLELMLEQRFKPARYTPQSVWRYASYAMGRRITLQALGTEATVHLFAPQPIQARLHTRQQAPEALPENLVAYSLFLRPERMPSHIPVDIAVEFQVPESIVAREFLQFIRIYRHTASLGWQPMPQQNLDTVNGIFTAQDGAPAVYVVLGPPEYMQAPLQEMLEPTVPLPPLLATIVDSNVNENDTAQSLALPPVESLPVYHPFPLEPPTLDHTPPLMPRDPNSLVLPWGEINPEIIQDETYSGEYADIIHQTTPQNGLDEFLVPEQQYLQHNGIRQDRDDALAPFPQMIQPPPATEPVTVTDGNLRQEIQQMTPVQRNFGPRQRR